MFNIFKLFSNSEKKDIPPPVSPNIETIWPNIDNFTQHLNEDPLNCTNFTTLVQKYGTAYIFACVNKLATSCRLFKPKVVKILNNGAIEPINTASTLKLLKEPNTNYGFPTLIEATAISLALTGNAYWEIIKVNNKAIGFFVLQPQRIIILKDKTGKIGGYEYHLSNGQKIVYKPEEIIHFKIYNIQDDFYGLSPLVAANIPQRILKKVDEFLENYFKNGGVFRGVLETEKHLPKPVYDRLTERFKALYTGLSKAFVIPVLEGGLRFKPVQVLPKDSQAFETSTKALQVLFAVFNTHPGLLGFEKLNHATLRELRAMYWEETVVPFITRIEEALNAQKAKFMPSSELDYEIEFDHSQIEALKVNELLKARIATTYGALSINEIRSRLFGLPPVEWGDVALLPLNMIPTSGDLESTPNMPRPKKSFIQLDLLESPIEEKEISPLFQTSDEYLLYYNTFRFLLEEDFKDFFTEQFNKTAGFLAEIIIAGQNNPYLDKRIEEVLTGSITNLRFKLESILKKKLMNIYFSILSKLDPEKSLYFDSNPLIEDFVSRWTKTLLDIVNDTTKRQLVNELLKIDINKDLDEVSKAIRKVFSKLLGNVYIKRLDTISRTEATRFINFASFLAHKDCGYTHKTWKCINAKQSRHKDLHNKTIPINNYFDVHGYKVLFPGDPVLPAADVCNCKCRLQFSKIKED